MRYVKWLLLIGAALALSACGGGASSSVGSAVLSMVGGNGTSGAGGKGGAFATMQNFSSVSMLNPASPSMQNFSSAVHGDLRFHAGGSVNAVIAAPAIVPELGANPAVINGDIQVATTAQTTPNALYVLAGDPNLYLVNTSGVGVPVTGLTVNTKLHLPSNTVATVIPKAIVIIGTLTSDGADLNLRSDTLIDIIGAVTSKPTTAGAAGGHITLLSGGSLINQGIIDASGSDGSSGVPGGASGGVTLQANNFIYNTLIVNAKGGNSTDNTAAGGAGGAIQFLSASATVATSGAVDSSGGNGASGGSAGPITFSGGSASAIGRVSMMGLVNANGGTGTSGNAGNGGALSFTSFSGGILIAADISANGGNSTNGNGGAGAFLSMKNRVGTDSASLHVVSPEGIKVTGNILLNGGNGAAGGNGGAVAVASDVTGDALQGFANVEFFGYQVINLNGGISVSSNGGDGGTIIAILSSPAPIVGVDIPAGGIYNEVPIFANGGDNNPSSLTVKSAPGGNGGTVQFVTPQTGNTVDPARTLVNNASSITNYGGAGTSGGAGGTTFMTSYGNLASTGGISSNGGNGTTLGGGIGGSIILRSSSGTVASGGIVVFGGNGAQGGNGGITEMTAGNQVNANIISAYGGSSTNGGAAGSGGSVTFLSEFAMTLRGNVNVARGATTGQNNAVNGTVTVDGVPLATSLPNNTGLV